MKQSVYLRCILVLLNNWLWIGLYASGFLFSALGAAVLCHLPVS